MCVVEDDAGGVVVDEVSSGFESDGVEPGFRKYTLMENIDVPNRYNGHNANHLPQQKRRQHQKKTHRNVNKERIRLIKQQQHTITE